MSLRFLSQNKKYLIVLAIIAVLFLLSGIVTPWFMSNKKKNWDAELERKTLGIEKSVQDDFRIKENFLTGLAAELKKDLEPAESKEDLIDLASRNSLQNRFPDLSLEVYDDSSGLLFWNGQIVFADSSGDLKKIRTGRCFFKHSGLQWFMSFADTLKAGENNFYFALSLPVEKEYKLSNQYYRNLSITDSLSAAFNTGFRIYFNPDSEIEKDGRAYYFDLKNKAGDRIAVVSFEKPYLDVELNWWRDFFKGLQSVLVILFVVVLGLLIRDFAARIGRRTVRFIVYLFYLSLLRFIIFFAGVPTEYLKVSVTESSYFSSVFAFGIVRSPLEFSITLLFALLAVWIGYKYSLEYYTRSAGSSKRSFPVFAASGIIALFFYLLSLRGLGASIRSIIFDSTLRYFKSPSLIPELPGILMLGNVLILGLIVILFALLLLYLTFAFIPLKTNRSRQTAFLNVFVIFQAAAFVYDITQQQPQGTPLIRFIFICLTFLLAYPVIIRLKHSAISYLYYVLAASVVSVSLLSYYNSELERESLKTTAQEITRVNENQYEFMVFQTVAQAASSEILQSALQERNVDLSPIAFSIWSGSLLQKETIPSYVLLTDGHGKLLSRFEIGLQNMSFAETDYPREYPDEIKIARRTNIYGGGELIVGSGPVLIDNKIEGYLEIGASFEEGIFNLQYFPKYLIGTRSGINSAVDYDKLEIFSFKNGSLVHSFGGVNLSEPDIKNLLGREFANNEAWTRIVLNREDFLFYLSKPNGNDRIIAVGIEEKNFSWNLYDFFKIFFMHLIFILAATIIYQIISFRKTKIIFSTFRARLVLAFLAVSLLPLFFLAGYFRNLTEEKNRELLTSELGRNADLIEQYAKNYISSSDISLVPIFWKAGRDLNLKFEIFDGKRILFSNYQNLVNASLEPGIINPEVYFEFRNEGLTSILVKERINDYSYNSVYRKSEIAGIEYIIKVSDVYNNIDFPLSDLDIDIFLFGTYSLAAILLIILSAFFANQISAPIRKLTSATRSVAGGDLNVELEYYPRGEVRELIEGFNRMVRELKKSQTELGQMERELAWKEMAKQVAHEIKNPLTPMKLAVQQLSAAYNDNSPKFNSIFEKVTATLISQIETLKNIASEFSNFARMPGLKIEIVRLSSVIQETADLFADERAKISVNGFDSEIILNADRDHLKRTFINLIRNSIQAGANKIEIAALLNDGNCEIRVKDNGIGIPAEIISRVFEDNFTTKTHGMGIGLSMSKRFIESIQGTIAVDESSGNGTVILIIIPAVMKNV